ncbi:30S ribosomal protein S6 [Candidatus Soleaferrea massiliensis]|uniref:30S ribosomal protein S6 n=1 Tax=Candidatus Soleaferrea massiliensis TaxID=1470354 RepID=UPI00058E7B02|nr:30S ribosomal protein S6 [Candidatus Soleaferrea massiliensis]
MAKILESYETVMIINTQLGEEGIAALIEKFKNLITRHEGTVDNVDEWGKRRLAYEINDETEGYYVLIDFTCTPEFPAELDRRYKINDNILRSLIVKK